MSHKSLPGFPQLRDVLRHSVGSLATLLSEQLAQHLLQRSSRIGQQRVDEDAANAVPQHERIVTDGDGDARAPGGGLVPATSDRTQGTPSAMHGQRRAEPRTARAVGGEGGDDVGSVVSQQQQQQVRQRQRPQPMRWDWATEATLDPRIARRLRSRGSMICLLYTSPSPRDRG